MQLVINSTSDLALNCMSRKECNVRDVNQIVTRHAILLIVSPTFIRNGRPVEMCSLYQTAAKAKEFRKLHGNSTKCAAY